MHWHNNNNKSTSISHNLFALSCDFNWNRLLHRKYSSIISIKFDISFPAWVNMKFDLIILPIRFSSWLLHAKRFPSIILCRHFRYEAMIDNRPFLDYVVAFSCWYSQKPWFWSRMRRWRLKTLFMSVFTKYVSYSKSILHITQVNRPYPIQLCTHF
jgi:hypothetical protein